MYYNASDEIDARRWQRLRDLLEADSLLQSRYAPPKLVGGVWRENVSSEVGLVISVTPTGDAFGNATPKSHETRQGMTLVVQAFVDMSATGDPTVALTSLMNVTTVAREALLRYRTEPAPLAEAARLWDDLTLKYARDTDYFPVPNKDQWASLTHFELYDYRRNR